MSRELLLMLECYCGIPSEEDIEELNSIQRKKVRDLLEKYGWCYGVNINLNEYHPKPIYKVSSEREACCDALIPPNVDKEKLKELEELIRFWNANSLKLEGRKALDKIFDLLDELGAVDLNWY